MPLKLSTALAEFKAIFWQVGWNDYTDTGGIATRIPDEKLLLQVLASWMMVAGILTTILTGNLLDI